MQQQLLRPALHRHSQQPVTDQQRELQQHCSQQHYICGHQELQQQAAGPAAAANQERRLGAVPNTLRSKGPLIAAGAAAAAAATAADIISLFDSQFRKCLRAVEFT
ncbi:hypothetical protein ETH_00006660 [Eimeria tenella]|uniref:Uncharacterized protein n=1 Tax=Eimeria tenella TaxID=5802 RepID=U6L0G9_EIMTE|nr:hypothetical protein ETH_00006660 [Eimeria tenella]CDJ42683.1 hypothetical protein ETH_00006660 [Eimeria tenella]|eukprot:XP_013233433.1 hypothetical protein ETH_00006660 [Eimeria tenella]